MTADFGHLDRIPAPVLERMLRREFDRRLRAGDTDGAVEFGANLTAHLTRTRSARAAYAVNEQVRDLLPRSSFGPWTALAVEAQRLRIVQSLGRNDEVLAALSALRGAPAAKGRELWPESEVREQLAAIGASAAQATRNWMVALAYLDEERELLGARSAPATATAAVDVTRAIALREMGELDAADTVLLAAQETAQRSGDPSLLAMVLGSRGKIARERGDRRAALRLQHQTLRLAYQRPQPHLVATAHRHLADYLPGDHAEEKLAHALAASLVHRFSGDEGELRDTLSELMALAPAPQLLDRVSLDWLRDTLRHSTGSSFAALGPALGLTTGIARTILAELVGMLRDRDAPTVPAMVRRWEPAIAAIAAAAGGDRAAREALDTYLRIRAVTPEWSALVTVLRAIRDGARDLGALTAGLDETDTAIVRHALGVLDGSVRPVSAVADLAVETAQARHRYRSVVEVLARHLHVPQPGADVWLEHAARVPGGAVLTATIRAMAARPAEAHAVLARVTPELTADQLALLTDVADEAARGGTTGQPPGEIPDRSDLDTVRYGGADQDAALLRIRDLVRRNLRSGHREAGLRDLKTLILLLLSRLDAARALPVVEELIAVEPGAPVDPLLASGIVQTALEQAGRIQPEGIRQVVGDAIPRRTPGYLGVSAGPEAVRQAGRWAAAADAVAGPDPADRAFAAAANILVDLESGQAARAVERAGSLLAETGADFAVHLLAMAYLRAGRPREALPLHDRIVETAPDAPGLQAARQRVSALGGRAEVLSSLGRDHRALADLREAQRVGAPWRDDPRMALDLGPLDSALGHLLVRLGDVPAAVEAHHSAWSLARRAGHRNGQGHQLHALGTLFGQVALDELRIHSEEAASRLASVLLDIDPAVGQAAAEGPWAVARTLLRLAARTYREAHNERGWAGALNDLSNLIPRDRPQEALAMLAEVRDAKERGDDHLGLAVTLANIGGWNRRRGQDAEAEQAYRRSLDISMSGGYFESAEKSAVALAGLLRSRGDLAGAEDWYRTAVGLIENGRQERPYDDRSRIAYAAGKQSAYTGLVECLRDRDAPGEAYTVVQQAKSRALADLLRTADLHPRRAGAG
ncbi:tetratricopeptide repeat protein, partial [Actinoplanes siamensis]|uniref:tetratricopeptide repeat protein n=1 Tax=Actinoplanes siamensis TaxID=1223317 RepID=UPI003613352C